MIAATMFCKNNLFNNITGFHFVKLPAQMGLNLDVTQFNSLPVY